MKYDWTHMRNHISSDPACPLRVKGKRGARVNSTELYQYLNSLRDAQIFALNTHLLEIRKTMISVRKDFNHLGIGKLRLITSHASYNKEKLSLYFAVVSGVSSNSYTRIRVDDVNDYITNMDISIDDLELVANARFQCVFLNEQAVIALAQLRAMKLQQNEMDRNKELAVQLSNKWTD